MKGTYRSVFVTIVTVEVLLAAYFGFSIYHAMQRRKIQSTSVSIIHKENNVSTSSSQLKYFYEPISETTEVDTTPWLTEKIAWKYNNDTLNDRFNYSVEKPANTLRIVALGDSFTFGDHVNTADAWPERLEDFLNAFQPCRSYTRYEVLNLGLRGTDVQYMTERYRIRGAKYTPDLVIWLLISRNLSQVRELMDGRAREIYSQEKKEGTLDLRWPWGRPSQIADDEFHKKYTPQQIAHMQDGYFFEFLRMYSGNVLLAPIGDIEEKHNKQIKQWTHLRKNIFYADGLPKIWGNPQKLHLIDGHPSEFGHMRIATQILAILRNTPQLLCM